MAFAYGIDSIEDQGDGTLWVYITTTGSPTYDLVSYDVAAYIDDSAVATATMSFDEACATLSGIPPYQEVAVRITPIDANGSPDEMSSPIMFTWEPPVVSTTIKKLVMLPTCGVVGEYVDPPDDHTGYDSLQVVIGPTATWQAQTGTQSYVAAEATVPVGQFPRFPVAAGVSYTVGVRGMYAWGNAPFGPTVVFTPICATTWAAYLRQRVTEIITAAAITIPQPDDTFQTTTTRNLKLLVDRWGRPRSPKQVEISASKTPLLAILPPVLRTVQMGTETLQTEVYEVHFLLEEAGTDEDACWERAQYVVDEVRAAIDVTKNLGMYGVADNSWTWTVSDLPMVEGQTMEFSFKLTVPIVTCLGKRPFET